MLYVTYKNYNHEKAMRKDDIIRIVSNKTGIDKDDVSASINIFLIELRNSIENGSPVYLRGFGTFSFKTRKGRYCRDVRKNKPIFVPERKVVWFKPCLEFKNNVKNNN